MKNTELLRAVSDLIEDLHENHDYFANWLGCNCAPDHGARYVRKLLRMLRQSPEYTEWADFWLQKYASADEPADTDRSLKGLTPETWLCIDCGTNTSPGMSTRAELEAALAVDENDEGVEQSVTAKSEVYTVRDQVWAAAGMEPWGGCLCIGCLEKRLGRVLKPKDF